MAKQQVVIPGVHAFLIGTIVLVAKRGRAFFFASRPDYDMLEDEMNPPPRPFTPQDPDPAASPCTRVCTLDENNVCLGCARSLTEITRWSAMTDAERRAVVARLRVNSPTGT